VTPGLLTELVALAVPPACPACRAPLPRADLRLCASCTRALPWLPARGCARCGLPVHRRRCPAAGAAFHRAWAPPIYDGVARGLVAALKFRGALPLADLMAAHMAANLPPELRPRVAGADGPAGTAVVPVPPHPGRRRRRGFDPAGALAAALARRLGVPRVDALRRRDRAARQVGTSRAERRRSGRLVVEPDSGAARLPSRVLLVDDVHTTGATLDAGAGALVAAGCGHVAAVTYARTL
jgi:predicted amidophosphoribosyltransferase